MYPIMLSLYNKPVVVIGGGAVAERKVRGLIEAGSNLITIVSPQLTTGLLTLEKEDLITWKQKLYEPSDLEGAFLVIAATNDRLINTAVSEDCSSLQLINNTDKHERSNFQVPAVYRNGDLIISISTSGASPKLAKKIKQDIEKQYDEQFGDYLQFLKIARQKIISQVQDSSKKQYLLQEIIGEPFFNSQERYKLLEELLSK